MRWQLRRSLAVRILTGRGEMLDPLSVGSTSRSSDLQGDLRVISVVRGILSQLLPALEISHQCGEMATYTDEQRIGLWLQLWKGGIEHVEQTTDAF